MRARNIVIFVAIVGLILFGAIWYYFINNNSTTQSSGIRATAPETTALSYTSEEAGIAFNVPAGYAMSEWRDISGRADKVNIFAEIYKTNPDGTAIDAPPVLAFERVRGLPFPIDADLSNLGVVTGIKPINLNCGQGKILTVETEDYGGEKIIYHVYLFHDGQNLFRLSGWEGVDWPGADEFVNSIKLLNCVK